MVVQTSLLLLYSETEKNFKSTQRIFKNLIFILYFELHNEPKSDMGELLVIKSKTNWNRILANWLLLTDEEQNTSLTLIILNVFANPSKHLKSSKSRIKQMICCLNITPGWDRWKFVNNNQ